VLPDALVDSGDFVRRFEREARAVAALNHPHICQIYDVALSGTGSARSYIVLEYVDGTPLRGPMTTVDALPLAIQIAEALEAAHRRGILHRDLKPANILVTGAAGSAELRPSVKLLDFGLAKEVMDPSDHTAVGTIAGTPGYMSPEQAQGGPIDARSDIFSFGVVLWEVLSGRPAFGGDSAAEVLSAVLRDDPPPLDPSALAQVVKRCLEKQASKRYQTAGELRAALEGAARSIQEHEPSIAVCPLPISAPTRRTSISATA
jgi:serine/threonine protein kinase